MIPNDLQISYPLPEDKWMIADLWQDSFNDLPEFIEVFFDRVYEPENTLVIKRDGFVISTLQILPYKLKFKHKPDFPVAYICGACTHPFERRKGLMKALIIHAKLEIKKRGFFYAIVKPADLSLFNFYMKLGFTQIINHNNSNIYTREYVSRMSLKKTPFTFEDGSIKYYPYFLRNQNKGNLVTVHHDVYDFETILQEYESCGGKVVVAIYNNEPVGMAFAEKIPQNIAFIKKIIATNGKVRMAICKYIAKVFNADYVKIYNPGCSSNPSEEYYHGLACKIRGNVKLESFFDLSLVHD